MSLIKTATKTGAVVMGGGGGGTKHKVIKTIWQKSIQAHRGEKKVKPYTTTKREEYSGKPLRQKTPKTKAKTVRNLLIFLILYTLLFLSENSGHLTLVRLQQPQEQRYPVLQAHAGSFRISVIHRTLILTTGSLTYVRDHSYACVFTRVGR